MSATKRRLDNHCPSNHTNGSGLPDGNIFRPKIPIWVHFVGAWNGKSWYTLRPFGIGILWPLGNLVAIWYIFPRFGMLCQEKSGQPGMDLPTRQKSCSSAKSLVSESGHVLQKTPGKKQTKC
jgi:hypothetical protein